MDKPVELGQAGNPSPANRTKPKFVQRFVIAAALLTVLVFIASRISSSSEPEYKGITLSGWLERYNNEVDADPQRKEAADAIRQIGPKALPVALRWLRVSDSKFKLKIIDLLERQNVFKFSSVPADDYHQRALKVFEILGPTAEPAIPGLVKLLILAHSAEDAAQALLSIGPAAVPAIVTGLTNSNPHVRRITADSFWSPPGAAVKPIPVLPNDLLLKLLSDSDAAIRRLAAHEIGEAAEKKSIRPDLAIPALIEALGKPDSQDHVVVALGKLGPEAKAATAGLLELLGDVPASDTGNAILKSLRTIGASDSMAIPAIAKNLRPTSPVRIWAAETLGTFGPAAASSIPALLNCIADPPARNSALTSLNSLGAKPSDLIPALEQNLNSDDPSTRVWSATVLASYGAEAKAAAPALVQAAVGQKEQIRTAIYFAVQKIDPEAAAANANILDVHYVDPSAIPLLIKTLSSDKPLDRRVAADCLAKYGPIARAAVPALLTALDDQDKNVRSAAGIALKKIDPAAAQKAGIK